VLLGADHTPFPVRQPSKYLIQLRSPILKRRPQCMPTRATLQCVGTPIAAFACDFGAWVTGILLPCHLVYLSARGTLAIALFRTEYPLRLWEDSQRFERHPCRRTRRHDRFGSVIPIFGADQHSSSFPTSMPASRERRIENPSPHLPIPAGGAANLMIGRIFNGWSSASTPVCSPT
jgi:hypothetical protein